MTDIAEINLALADLQVELETLRSYAAQIGEAKDAAVKTIALSSKLSTSFDSITRSSGALVSKIEHIDFPKRFESMDENLHSLTDRLDHSNKRLSKINEIYLEILTEVRKIEKNIDETEKDVKKVNQKLVNIDKSIESVPLKLEKLDITMSSINQLIQNEINRLSELERNLREDIAQRSVNVENNIKEYLRLSLLEISKKNKTQFLVILLILFAILIIAGLSFLK